MDDVYARITRLPRGIKAYTAPCLDGWNVYIDDQLSDGARKNAYDHEIRHILSSDWEKNDVQKIEHNAHEKEVKNGNA